MATMAGRVYRLLILKRCEDRWWRLRVGRNQRCQPYPCCTTRWGSMLRWRRPFGCTWAARHKPPDDNASAEHKDGNTQFKETTVAGYREACRPDNKDDDENSRQDHRQRHKELRQSNGAVLGGAILPQQIEPRHGKDMGDDVAQVAGHNDGQR